MSFKHFHLLFMDFMFLSLQMYTTSIYFISTREPIEEKSSFAMMLMSFNNKTTSMKESKKKEKGHYQ